MFNYKNLEPLLDKSTLSKTDLAKVLQVLQPTKSELESKLDHIDNLLRGYNPLYVAQDKIKSDNTLDKSTKDEINGLITSKLYQADTDNALNKVKSDMYDTQKITSQSETDRLKTDFEIICDNTNDTIKQGWMNLSDVQKTQFEKQVNASYEALAIPKIDGKKTPAETYLSQLKEEPKTDLKNYKIDEQTFSELIGMFKKIEVDSTIQKTGSDEQKAQSKVLSHIDKTIYSFDKEISDKKRSSENLSFLAYLDSSKTLDTKEIIDKILSSSNKDFLNKLSKNAKEDLEKILNESISDKSKSFQSFLEKEKEVLDKDRGALETTKESYKSLSKSYSEASPESVVKDLEAKKEGLRKQFQTSKDSLFKSGANQESAKEMIDTIDKAINNPLDLRQMQELKDQATELDQSRSKGLMTRITGKSNFHNGLESLIKAIDEHVKSPAVQMNPTKEEVKEIEQDIGQETGKKTLSYDSFQAQNLNQNLNQNRNLNRNLNRNNTEGGVPTTEREDLDFDAIMKAYKEFGQSQTNYIESILGGTKDRHKIHDYPEHIEAIHKENLSQFDHEFHKEMANRFADKFKPMWADPHNKAEQTIRQVDVADGVTLTETNIKDIEINGQKIKGARKIDFPRGITEAAGPLHLSMAIKDINGENMPKDSALYFTAHYDKAGKLQEMTYPIPIEFSGKGDDDDQGFIRKDGKIYTLPIDRGTFMSMTQEIEMNKGIEQEKSQDSFRIGGDSHKEIKTLDQKKLAESNKQSFPELQLGGVDIAKEEAAAKEAEKARQDAREAAATKIQDFARGVAARKVLSQAPLTKELFERQKGQNSNNLPKVPPLPDGFSYAKDKDGKQKNIEIDGKTYLLYNFEYQSGQVHEVYINNSGIPTHSDDKKGATPSILKAWQNKQGLGR